MSSRLFGTDGIRARFGDEPLTEGTVRRIGAALAGHLRDRTTDEPLVLIGGDTRASTSALVDWVCDGLGVGGARTLDLGVVTTGAVARLVPEVGAAAGLVVSASHNPAADNGLKLVGPDGFKWSVADEDLLTDSLKSTPAVSASGRRPLSGAHLVGFYLDRLAAIAPGKDALRGMSIALDCAHGAASGVAGELFASLGAEVELLFAAPDGANINRDCGSTHPQALAARLRSGGLDLGFAFDGDADRALLFDAQGELHDGDAMLFLWARNLASKGELEPPRIVATSMSNLGLERALAAIDVGVERCDVGDRAVVATLRRSGLRLGGEQSGHLVDLRRSTTGDGLLTAIALAAIVARSGRPVAELVAPFRRYPQVLLSVQVRAKPAFDSLPRVAAAARAVEERLGADGRLLLRYSGTEPLARIMLEGPDEVTVSALAEELASEIRAAIGV